MKQKVLLLPFLQIPSGHHRAADNIKIALKAFNEQATFQKIELLSYCFGNIERVISFLYLQWIRISPRTYSILYRLASIDERNINKRYYFYEWLFMRKMMKLLTTLQPDVIICTHALPSYLISRLKEKRAWNGIVVNVYTDYFVHHVWGRKSIDYHLVPSQDVKDALRSQGIKEEQLFLTGIPVHPLFKRRKQPLKKGTYQLLISGGNMGAGSIRALLKQIKPSGKIHYTVLCGKNKRLFQQLKRQNHAYIKPVSFIHSNKEMDALYNEMDGIITKPGGLTITECLYKGIPIFIYDALPGQEEMNLAYLQKNRFIYHVKDWRKEQQLEEKLLVVLEHPFQLLQQTTAFIEGLEDHEMEGFFVHLTGKKRR